ncbi:phosphoribosyltransferase [Patescibacteria group bacterium]|nr:phosphoribosyltransferase [Patescibacteria group bacterium]
MFKDRQSAGQLLAEKLKDIKADIVLGIPRGGVVVAKEVANELKLPLDIVVTRKIGAPGQEELALGAVDADGQVVWDETLLAQLELRVKNLEFRIKEERKELVRREKLYRQGRKPLDIENKEVVLVDDGVATGATTLSAIKYLKRHGAKIILAVPVASREALDKMENEVEKLVVLEIPGNFAAVGQFYDEFLAVFDQEVIQLLK